MQAYKANKNEISVKEEKAEGIVLRSQEFQEKKRIISLLTSSSGLIQLVVAGLSERRSHLFALTTPFTIGEYHYWEGRSNLYRFTEGTVLDEQLFLREKLAYLETAGAMAKWLLDYLLPNAPDLVPYLLLKSFIKQIPHFEEKKLLLATFFIKMLQHEGALDLQQFPATYHQQIIQLAEMRHFSALKQIILNQNLLDLVIMEKNTQHRSVHKPIR